MDKIKLAAISAFGLEAIVKRELTDLGYDKIFTDNGWMYFDAEIQDICKTNIHLRCADRVMLVMGQFEALSFEELFEDYSKHDYKSVIKKLEQLDKIEHPVINRNNKQRNKNFKK